MRDYPNGCLRVSGKRPKKTKPIPLRQKKRHTLKTQLVVDRQSLRVIHTTFTNGKVSWFQIVQNSKLKTLASAKIPLMRATMVLQKFMP